MSRLLVVMAMHRSGSSLVARSLKCLGAELGEAAEWSGPDNPTGFWEHRGVLAINEHVLRLSGGRWDLPPDEVCLTECCQRLKELIYLRGAAEHMLRRELEQYPVFAIKDPRLCVLMPFWKPVLAGLGCQVSFIRVVRHPDAVAASLQRRDKMDRDKALRLWLRYTEAAEPSVVVDYDHLMSLPFHEIERLGTRLGLKVNVEEAGKFAADFIDDTLWHEPEEGTLPVEINVVWQQVRREATEP